MPSSVQVGLTVGGRDTNAVAVVRFRDYGAVSEANEVTYLPQREGLGLSSRRTRIVFSEIQYHPQTLPGSPGLEFVELYNAGDVFEDLSRWKIEGTVRFQFPEGFLQLHYVAGDGSYFSRSHGQTARVDEVEELRDCGKHMFQSGHLKKVDGKKIKKMSSVIAWLKAILR